MQTIQLKVNGPVATVSLNRPEVRNAFNAQMIAELTEAFQDLAKQDRLRAVVLEGEGASFSAGADANWMRTSLDFSPEENRADAMRMSDVFGTIQDLQAPVIARVHGAALGGGMGLLAACDIVVAAEGTTFGFTETKLGIVPAVISRVVLAKIGPSWARALYVTGERFGPETARHIGLVHWVVPEDDLDATVEARVGELLASGPCATRAAKQLVLALMEMAPADIPAYTAERIAELRASPEGQEGLRAFLEKRKPAWRGDG